MGYNLEGLLMLMDINFHKFLITWSKEWAEYPKIDLKRMNLKFNLVAFNQEWQSLEKRARVHWLCNLVTERKFKRTVIKRKICLKIYILSVIIQRILNFQFLRFFIPNVYTFTSVLKFLFREEFKSIPPFPQICWNILTEN